MVEEIHFLQNLEMAPFVALPFIGYIIYPISQFVSSNNYFLLFDRKNKRFK